MRREAKLHVPCYAWYKTEYQWRLTLFISSIFLCAITRQQTEHENIEVAAGTDVNCKHKRKHKSEQCVNEKINLFCLDGLSIDLFFISVYSKQIHQGFKITNLHHCKVRSSKMAKMAFIFVSHGMNPELQG